LGCFIQCYWWFYSCAYYLAEETHEDSAWYDVLEYIFDFPYRFTAALLRAVVKGGSDAIDIDL